MVDVSEIAESDLESMIQILEKSGNNWPSWPQNFEIPDDVKSKWSYKNYSWNHCAAVLRGKHDSWLSVGDSFNAVPLPKKRKRGVKYSDRHQRIYQFFRSHTFFGHVDVDKSLSGRPVLKKGQVRKDLVYRFEIVSVDYENWVFHCVPLAEVFNKDNLLDNLIDCNYKKGRK